MFRNPYLVGRVSQLSRRAESYLHFVDGVGEVGAESGGETSHVVSVHFERSSSLEESLVIHSQTEVLLVRRVGVVFVEDVVVAPSHSQHPGREGNVTVVSHVSSALVFWKRKIHGKFNLEKENEIRKDMTTCTVSPAFLAS